MTTPRETGCGAGTKIKDIRERFEREVAGPILETGKTIALPITFEDMPALLALVPVVTAIIPTAEGLGAELRAVEDELLLLCEGEPPPPPPPPPPDDEPEITVLSPGTPQVAGWPIVQEPPFAPEVADGTLTLRYGERLDEATWPGFVIPFMQTPGQPEEHHHGNAWIVFPDGRAFPFEWLRRERERNETAKEVEYIVEQGRLTDGDRVWFFLAGPSRHVSNQTVYRRRTRMRPFIWGAGALAPA